MLQYQITTLQVSITLLCWQGIILLMKTERDLQIYVLVSRIRANLSFAAISVSYFVFSELNIISIKCQTICRLARALI